MINNTVKILIIISIFLFTTFVFSQQTDFNLVIKAFEKPDLLKVEVELEKIDTVSINKYDKATWLYYFSDYNFKIDKHHLAFKNIIKAKKLFIKLNENKDVTDCNLLLIGILSHQNELEINIEDIINELTEYVKNNKDINALKTIYRRLAIKFFDLNNRKKSIQFFKKIVTIVTEDKKLSQLAHSYNNIGITYNSIKPLKLDSALYYFKKAEPILIENNEKRILSYNYNNQGNTYKIGKNYDDAIVYFKKADSIFIKEFKSKTKLVFYKNMSETYHLNNDFKNASIYYEKFIKLKDSINDKQQNIEIVEIKEKYENENERERNKKLKTKMNTILPILAITILLLGVVFILYKKYHKKSKNLEEEKSETLTKLEELKEIVIKNHIVLKDKTKIYIADLMYVKSDDHYLKIFLSNGKNHFVRGKLSNIIEELPPNFIRCHRSYIVNRNYIKQINNTNIVLTDKTELPLSRSYKDKL